MLTPKSTFPWAVLIGVVFLGLMVVALWGQVFPVSGTTALPDSGTPTSAYAVEYQGGSTNIIIGAAMLLLIVLGAWLSSRNENETKRPS